MSSAGVHANREGTVAIHRDLACARCGYNLRGLLSTAACPECNQSVSDSLFGRLLRFADSSYVRSIRRGFLLVGHGQRWIIATTIGLLCALPLLVVISAFAVPVLVEQLLAGTLGMLLLIGSVLVACGTWLLLSPEDQSETSAAAIDALVRGVCTLAPFGVLIWVMLPTLLKSAAFNTSSMNLMSIHVILGFTMLYIARCGSCAAGLQARCASISAAEVSSVRTRVRVMAAMPLVMLVLFWIGPVRNDLTGRGWQMPDQNSASLLFIGTAILWLVGLQLLSSTRKVVEQELAESTA